jgi:hypothetical protein
VLFALESALLLASAGLASAWLCRGSLATFLLGMYVLAYAEIVVVSLGLSAVDELSGTGYLVGFAAVFAATACAAAVSRPTLPPVRRPATQLADALRDPVLATLAVVDGLALAYAAALGLLTAQNDGDVQAYHLARPAFWLQQQSIGYLDFGEDARLSAFPPGAEIVLGFMLAGVGSDRLVAMPCLVSVGVMALAAHTIARRLGLDGRKALFGALVIPLLPVVALQSQTALNDLPLAALVAAAVALLMRRCPTDLALAAVAVSLALVTKVTALPALAPLAVIAWLTWRPRWRPLAVAGGVAVAGGSAWYVVNLVQTGELFGRFPSEQRGSHDPVEAVGRVLRMSINLLEVPGAQGRDRLVFVFVGAVLLAGGIVAWRRGRWGLGGAIAAGLIVALTPTVLALNRLVLKVYQKAWHVLGRDDIGFVEPHRSQDYSGWIHSWVGPVGLVMTFVGVAFAVRAHRRGQLPGLGVLLATAPVVWIVLVGLAVSGMSWNGRFTLAGYTLGAATWGLVLGTRWLAWALVATAATTVTLSFVHSSEKPSGVRLLEPRRSQSVFTMPRWQVEGRLEENSDVARFLDGLPTDASVASFPYHFPESPNDAYAARDLHPYLLFGARVGRTVHLTTTPRAALAAGADWYLSPTRALPQGQIPGWTRVLATVSGWTVLRREATPS